MCSIQVVFGTAILLMMYLPVRLIKWLLPNFLPYNVQLSRWAHLLYHLVYLGLLRKSWIQDVNYHSTNKTVCFEDYSVPLRIKPVTLLGLLFLYTVCHSVVEKESENENDVRRVNPKYPQFTGFCFFGAGSWRVSAAWPISLYPVLLSQNAGNCICELHAHYNLWPPTST